MYMYVYDIVLSLFVRPSVRTYEVFRQKTLSNHYNWNDFKFGMQRSRHGLYYAHVMGCIMFTNFLHYLLPYTGCGTSVPISVPYGHISFSPL